MGPSVKKSRRFLRHPWKWYKDSTRRHQLADRRREDEQITEQLIEAAEESDWSDWDCEEHGHIFVMGSPRCLICEHWQPEPEDLYEWQYGPPEF